MEKAPPTKRPRYDAVFRAEALRLASKSRSTLAAAQALPAGPTEAAEVRALRQANNRLAQELEILKKAIASKRFTRVISTSPTL